MIMNHTDWEDKPKKVDVLMAKTSPSYLESKDVDAIRTQIRKVVRKHKMLSAAELSRLIDVPRKWSLLDIAETVKDVLRIKDYYVHSDAEKTIEKLGKKQFQPSDQDQYGRRCMPSRRWL